MPLECFTSLIIYHYNVGFYMSCLYIFTVACFVYDVFMQSYTEQDFYYLSAKPFYELMVFFCKKLNTFSLSLSQMHHLKKSTASILYIIKWHWHSQNPLVLGKNWIYGWLEYFGVKVTEKKVWGQILYESLLFWKCLLIVVKKWHWKFCFVVKNHKFQLAFRLTMTWHDWPFVWERY